MKANNAKTNNNQSKHSTEINASNANNANASNANAPRNESLDSQINENLGIAPLISYPTRWEYIIIGKSENCIKSALQEIFSNKAYAITAHKVSAKGNFTSIHIALEVDSKEQRDSFFSALKNHSAVTMVI